MRDIIEISMLKNIISARCTLIIATADNIYIYVNKYQLISNVDVQRA